ncbi:dATP/dGTP diphosphohydrolase domain-containing protein [Phreatobacter sp. HK31-P]
MSAAEFKLPDNNPKTAFGILKPSFHAIPPAAIVYMGLAFADGAPRYGLMNWRGKSVSFSVYYDAMMRHMMACYDGEWLDRKSGKPHLGHAMACLGILADAFETGRLNDDRPIPGNFSEMVDRMTAEATARQESLMAANDDQSDPGDESPAVSAALGSAP